MTTKKKPVNRKQQRDNKENVRKTVPKGERLTDLGDGRPPSLQDIINSHVRQALDAHLVDDVNSDIIEPFSEFDDWDAPSLEPDWVGAAEIQQPDYEMDRVPLEPLPQSEGEPSPEPEPKKLEMDKDGHILRPGNQEASQAENHASA